MKSRLQTLITSTQINYNKYEVQAFRLALLFLFFMAAENEAGKSFGIEWKKWVKIRALVV